MATDRLVHAPAAVLDRLEVEPGPRCLSVLHPEDHYSAHDVRGAVRAGAAVLPLAPHGVSVYRHAGHLGGDVGDSGEDLRPVAAYLLGPDESPLGMYRCLVAVVRREARHDSVEVMRVRGSAQSVD